MFSIITNQQTEIGTRKSISNVLQKKKKSQTYRSFVNTAIFFQLRLSMVILVLTESIIDRVLN